MKLSTILLAIAFESSVFVVFPYFLIQLNQSFSLPIYSFVPMKILGAILAFAAITLHLSCFRLFRLVGHGTPVPTEPPQTLVVNGIYRHTRNPMYLALLAVSCAYFLFFGYLLLISYPLILTAFFHLFVILHEEPTLTKRFGKAYLEYCRKTPRWLWL